MDPAFPRCGSKDEWSTLMATFRRQSSSTSRSASKEAAGCWFLSIALHTGLLAALALLQSSGGKQRSASAGGSGIQLDARIAVAQARHYFDAPAHFVLASSPATVDRVLSDVSAIALPLQLPD